MKKALIFLLACILFSSCVHHSPFEGEKYFQAMGRDSEIVMTMDTRKVKDSGAISVPDNEVFERSERLSVALEPKVVSEESYPLGFEDYSYYGAFEGNYGKLSVNTVLHYMDGFEKVEGEDGIGFYSNGAISAAVPKSGLLLFSSSSYEEAYRRTYSERSLLIPSEIADRMSSSLASFYVKSPQTMIDLGFDLPITVLDKMEIALVMINETGSGLNLSADVLFPDERNAKTFTTILKNNMVADLRRKGEKLDFALLGKMIYQDGNHSIVFELPISDEEASKYMGNAEKLMGGLL